MAVMLEARSIKDGSFVSYGKTPIEKLQAKNIFSSEQKFIITEPIDHKRISKELTNNLTIKSAVKAILVFSGTIGSYYLAKTTGILSYFGLGSKNPNPKDVGNNEVVEVKNALSARRTSEAIEQTNSQFVNRIEQTYKGEDRAVKFEEIEVEGFKDFSKVKKENAGSRKTFGRRSISIQNPISDQKIVVGDDFRLPINGKDIFNADSAMYLEAINIPLWLSSSNPDPTFKGSYDIEESSWAEIAVLGNYAYIIDDYSNDFKIIDINDPAKPTFKSSRSFAFINMPSGIVVSENYAYVTDYYYGNLNIIDITNKTHPTIRGSYNTFGVPNGVAVSGDYAYVVTEYSGLEIIDITNVTNPTIKGLCDIPGEPWGITLSENYAYVVNEHGLLTVDINNPSDPVWKGVHYMPNYIYIKSIAVSGNYAYVTNGELGLQIINITDPSNPTFKSSYDTSDVAVDVVISENYAYIGIIAEETAENRNSSLEIVDISDPANPTFVNSYNLPEELTARIDISGNYAYVVIYGGGLQIIALNSENLTLSGIPKSGGTYIVDVRACNEQEECAIDSFNIKVNVPIDIGLVISLSIVGLIVCTICTISFCGSLISIGGIVAFRRYRNKILKDEGNTSIEEQKKEEESEFIMHNNGEQSVVENKSIEQQKKSEIFKNDIVLNEQEISTQQKYKEDVELDVI